MNKYIKLFIAAGLMGSAVGCTDLDVDNKSTYTYDPNPQLTELYTHLRETLGRRYMEAQALSSDEWVGISFDGGYYDDGTYAHACLHNYSPSDASIDWYEKVTAGITKANRKILSLSENNKESICAARAMRAYFHWILIDSYGDAPLLDHIYDKDEVVERQPRAKVAEFIANELEEIIPYLPETVDETTYGTPTKWMAEALLVSAQDGRHVEFLAVLVGNEHGYFVVAGLVTIVDDVGGIVSKLLFFTEITVVYNRVDVADGTVETDLVEVVVAARVVQVEQAAVTKGFGLEVVREALLRQVAEQRTFINIVVCVKFELLVLECDFLVGFCDETYLRETGQ